MARPVKEGLDYFPLVVDVYKNTKIRSLMRKKGGSRAFSIFITILCKIYEKGYYIEHSEDFIFDVAEDMHEEKEFVEDVINFCTEVNLIDKDTLKKSNVLTSKGIQEQYIESLKKSKRRICINKYKLIDEEKIINSINVGNTEVSSEETGVYSEITGVSSEKSTQKKIKENKNKIKPSKTSSTTARVRVCEDFFSEKYDASEDRLEKEIEILESDEEWKTKIMNHFGFSPQKLHEELVKFVESCRLMGRKNHPTYNDLQQHFKFWKDKDKNNDLNNRTDYGTRQNYRYASGIEFTHLDPRRPAPCPTGTSPSDYE